jgi:autotransporter-associated beta strand protein
MLSRLTIAARPRRLSGQLWVVPVAWAVAWMGAVGPAGAQVPAVMYHAHPNLGYVRTNFEDHLDFFAANGFTTITLDQFYQWRVHDAFLPYRPIMLTVDDNYILGYTEMYPALAARGMVATNYTHTLGIGIGQPKASWPQVAEMDAAGVFLLEAHSRSHPRLTSISAEQLALEVAGSRADILAQTGKVSDHFAYPYGDYNATVIEALAAAGFKTGMTTRKGLNFRDTPLFELRRWHGDGRTLDAFLREAGLDRLPPPPPGPGWVLDDADPHALPVGTSWTVTTGAATAYDNRHLIGRDGDTLRWAALLPEAGTMRIHARWVAAPGRSADVAYTIEAADGSHRIAVDQRSQGGAWVPLGEFAFAPGMPVEVWLGGGGGTLSADALWFEPVATVRAPASLEIDVAAGAALSQAQVGRGWIGPEWSSVTKTGPGQLVLDAANGLSGAALVGEGVLRMTTAEALGYASLLEVAGGAGLDVSALVGGYAVPAAQTLAGDGTIVGDVVFGGGGTLAPGRAISPGGALAGGAAPATGTAVPEPGTLLLLVATAASGWIGRRIHAGLVRRAARPACRLAAGRRRCRGWRRWPG